MFPALIGIAGLATEYGDALMTQIKAQRLADDAAYAGALAYMSAGSTTAMTNAADQIATLNGLPTADLTAISIVSSPSGDGNSAVQATVSIAVPLGLAKLVNSSGATTASVTANSYVELKGGSIPCFIALSSSGTGITLSGAFGLANRKEGAALEAVEQPLRGDPRKGAQGPPRRCRPGHQVLGADGRGPKPSWCLASLDHRRG